MSGLIGTSPFVSRQEWGARPPRSTSSAITPDGDTGHYDGGDVGTVPHDRCPAMVRATQAYHMDAPDHRWADIAYTSLECQHGYIFEGRWIGHRTAAQGTNDGNQRSYAHCVIAGPNDPLWAPAKRALVDVFGYCKAHGSGPSRWGHRDWHPTACPGDAVYAYIKAGMPAPNPSEAGHVIDGTLEELLLTPTGNGYYIVSDHGAIYAYGDAHYEGGGNQYQHHSPFVDMALHPTAAGYWLLGEDGSIWAFGASKHLGAPNGPAEPGPFRAIAAMPDGAGYLLAKADGAIFAYGSAHYLGAPNK